MKITDLHKEIEKLPASQRNAILAIIEIKTEGDMDKFISELKNFKESVSFKFNVIIWMVGILLVIIGFTFFK